MISLEPAISRRTRALLEEAIVWDNHGCMPLRADADCLPQLERYRSAGVNVISVNVGFGDICWTEHVRVISFMRRWLALHSDRFQLVATLEDIYRSKRAGRLAVIFDVEGMNPVIDDLSLVQTLYELGVRWMLIAYNQNNRAGGGCLDADGGLTDVGRGIIDEMERVGMVVCLSHAGSRTAGEALEYCRNPTIFSHSNPYGDTPHARNVSDELMLACARRGGVVGVSGIGPFLGAATELVERLLRQIRYVLELVGPQHVALGLDYVFDRDELDVWVRSHPSMFPSSTGIVGGMPMVPPEATAEIAEGLARQNLSDDDIKAILGGNWLRIAERVWR